MPPLDCARAPLAPPVTADDRDWAQYEHQDHDAGAECRDRLDAAKSVVGKWPHPSSDAVQK
jgi:hypothetical protein